MSRTLTLEGTLAAPDTRYILTSGGDESAPALVVPKGVTKIDRIRAAFSHDGAADDGSAVVFLRLGGNAVKNGEQTIVIGAAGNQTVQSGSDAAPNVMHGFDEGDLDIEVQEGDTISIAAEYGGVDIGNIRVAVTPFFA